MSKTRLIARLDVKTKHLVKSVRLEGIRKIGDPNEYAVRYYQQGADEIIYIDLVASLYGRINLTEVVKHTTDSVFVPLTVGGGVRSVEDAGKLLRAGADKVAVNTAALARPELIREISQRYGSQAMVLSIEAKKTESGDGWEPYSDCGRERTYKDVIEWAKEGETLGAGEILLTSIDREGTRKGFDLELTKAVSETVNIPVIASGGMGSTDDMVDVVKDGKADAVAMADILHYDRMTMAEIRQAALEAGLEVRQV